MARNFGEIDGYSEGRIFTDRKELHDAGVYAPLVAGISGSQTEGADSIVMSGGYEDDEDNGDFVIYTGHGGQDPSTPASNQALQAIIQPTTLHPLGTTIQGECSHLTQAGYTASSTRWPGVRPGRFGSYSSALDVWSRCWRCCSCCSRWRSIAAITSTSGSSNPAMIMRRRQPCLTIAVRSK